MWPDAVVSKVLKHLETTASLLKPCQTVNKQMNYFKLEKKPTLQHIVDYLLEPAKESGNYNFKNNLKNMKLEYGKPIKTLIFCIQNSPKFATKKKTQNRFQLYFEVIRLCDNKNMQQDNDMPDPPTHFNNMVFFLICDFDTLTSLQLGRTKNTK